MTQSNQCLLCKHYNMDINDSCRAYPDGIPNDIFNGTHTHTKPYGGEAQENGTPILFKRLRVPDKD